MANKIKAARASAFGVFKDVEMDWVFRRTLEYMNVGAAEIGECLSLVKKIDDKDITTWIDSWQALGDRVKKQGDESLEKESYTSARESYLRASNYYRNAEYGCLPDDPKFHMLWEKSVECFMKAGELFDTPIQRVTVPFEGKELPGYFWRGSTDNTCPTLFAVGGNDSSLEEVVYASGFAAVSRGYNFFTFDFPGHRGAVHLYPDMVKMPDYERPMKSALDVLGTLPGVDDRIAMTGMSFGGYIVSRTAIHDKRISVLVPNSPLVDLWDTGKAFWGKMIEAPFWVMKLLSRASKKQVRNGGLAGVLKGFSQWSNGYWNIPLKEQVEKLNEWKKYTIRESLSDITCPTLVMVSEDEGNELLKQANEFYNGISSELKHMHMFSMEQDGSHDHCQLDNRTRSNQVMFDWLDRVFLR